MRLLSTLLMLLGLMLADRDSDFMGPGHPPASDAFRALLSDPIPASETNLQGFGNTWQGYGFCLRFNASTTDIDALIEQGFKPATWTSISYHFKLPGGETPFTPDWNPASISTKECYELDGVKNGGTHSSLRGRSLRAQLKGTAA